MNERMVLDFTRRVARAQATRRRRCSLAVNRCYSYIAAHTHVLIQEMNAVFLCPFTLMGKTEQTEEKTFFVRATVKAFIAFRN